MEKKVFYLCDGKKEDCKRTNCYQNGGECKHTEDIEHAKNFSMTTHQEKSFWEEEKNRNCSSSCMHQDLPI